MAKLLIIAKAILILWRLWRENRRRVKKWMPKIPLSWALATTTAKTGSAIVRDEADRTYLVRAKGNPRQIIEYEEPQENHG